MTLTINHTLRSIPDYIPKPEPMVLLNRDFEKLVAYRLIDWQARFLCWSAVPFYFGLLRASELSRIRDPLDQLQPIVDRSGVERLASVPFLSRIPEVDDLEAMLRLMLLYQEDPESHTTFLGMTHIGEHAADSCTNFPSLRKENTLHSGLAWISLACQTWLLSGKSGWEGHVAPWHVDHAWDWIKQRAAVACQAADRVEFLPWWIGLPSISGWDSHLDWTCPTTITLTVGQDGISLTHVEIKQTPLAPILDMVCRSVLGFGPRYIQAYMAALKVKAHQEGWRTEFPTVEIKGGLPC